MSSYNLNQKTFVLVQNSENGKVNSETLFKYKQKQNTVWATYAGGPILYGTIVGHLKGEQLSLLYQCLTDTHELKAGKAIATVSKTSSNKLKLSLEWEWINGGKEKGSSEYVEIDTIIK